MPRVDNGSRVMSFFFLREICSSLPILHTGYRLQASGIRTKGTKSFLLFPDA